MAESIDIKETCSCGAKLELETNSWSTAYEMQRRFHEQHKQHIKSKPQKKTRGGGSK